ncbi:hypothetical protein B0H11DRAFT_1901926 [Mycena galericulata]|nr:hypothetical protein B0H11DRAFT_1901926 [Mycena galericulata]
MQKFRNDLLAFKNRIATETQQRQREKDTEAAAEKHRLEAIIVITDPAKLKKLPVKKKGVASLRDQLDVHRDLWKDDILLKTKLKDIAKKDDMLEAILAADHRYLLLVSPSRSLPLF